MKDILITLTPRNEQHLSACSTIATDLRERKIQVRLLTATSLLLTGEKSFETTINICQNLSDSKIEHAVVEVESVLLVSVKE